MEKEDFTLRLLEVMDERRKEEREENRLLHSRISNMKDELLQEIKEMRKEQEEALAKLDDRVTMLEKWKWTLAGAASVIGAAVTFVIVSIKDLFSWLN